MEVLGFLYQFMWGTTGSHSSCSCNSENKMLGGFIVNALSRYLLNEGFGRDCRVSLLVYNLFFFYE